MSQPAIPLQATRATGPSGAIVDRFVLALPGLAFCVALAVAATFLSQRFRLSAMVFGLLLGMAFNFVAAQARWRPGIEIGARLVLRTAVALLGLRIALSDVLSLGWAAISLAAAGIVVTMAMGLIFARALGLGHRFAVLSSGAVAICGASAALAVNSVLPRTDHTERDAGFVVIAVTILSTVAMFAYPLITSLAGFDDRTAGIFFGGTIHDVAQVVGAGYSVSQQAGDVATIMKLTRVAMLLPVCFAIGMIVHARGEAAARAAPIVPWFVAVFAVLVMVGSFGWIPESAIRVGGTVSGWLLVVAMAAIGMKTPLAALVKVGARAMILVVLETAFLALFVFAALAWMRGHGGL
ncbi:MAG TPA: putative sulfate exporter family transporter [Usitatibacter sp.]|nr:putative sulfate exporter family transporter [Usitatibacter sp.]